MRPKTTLLISLGLLLILLFLFLWLRTGEVKVIKEKTDDLSISIRYPITHIASIDQTFEKMISREIAEFRSAIPKVKPNPDWKYDLTIDFKVFRKSDLKTFVFTIFTFIGGAHPTTRTVTYCFDMKSGREIAITDVINPNQVLPIIIKELKSRKISDDKWIEEGAKDLSKFALSGNYLIIYYDQYQVAPYVAGRQEVRIKLRDIF